MPKIKQAAEEMLLQTIIPFWKGLRDEENGGFYGYMDFDLKLDKKAEKGCILNSRILWFFSEAAMLTGRADLAEDARHAELLHQQQRGRQVYDRLEQRLIPVVPEQALGFTEEQVDLPLTRNIKSVSYTHLTLPTTSRV